MALIDTYLARTPGSRALFERATASIPGGSTRTTVFNPPYPPYMTRGDGLRTWDVDGNEYRDFLGNYTSLILGHAHPDVVAAVEAQVRRGSAFAAHRDPVPRPPRRRLPPGAARDGCDLDPVNGGRRRRPRRRRRRSTCRDAARRRKCVVARLLRKAQDCDQAISGACIVHIPRIWRGSRDRNRVLSLYQPPR